MIKISGLEIFRAKTIQDSDKFSAFIPDLGRLTEENIPDNLEGVSVLFSDDSEDQSMPGSLSQVSPSLLRLGPVLEEDSSKWDGSPTPRKSPTKSIRNFFCLPKLDYPENEDVSPKKQRETFGVGPKSGLGSPERKAAIGVSSISIIMGDSPTTNSVVGKFDSKVLLRNAGNSTRRTNWDLDHRAIESHKKNQFGSVSPLKRKKVAPTFLKAQATNEKGFFSCVKEKKKSALANTKIGDFVFDHDLETEYSFIIKNIKAYKEDPDNSSFFEKHSMVNLVECVQDAKMIKKMYQTKLDLTLKFLHGLRVFIKMKVAADLFNTKSDMTKMDLLETRANDSKRLKDLHQLQKPEYFFLPP